MGEKNQNQTQIEKLIEMANQLEQRELALSRETRYLEEMKTSLEAQEKKFSAVKAERAEGVFQEGQAPQPKPVLREKPMGQPAAELQSVPKPAPMPVRQAAAAPAPQPVRQAAAAPVAVPQPVRQAVPAPVAAPMAVSAPAAQKPVPQKSAADAVTEINQILQSIFWDYSNSVHQISSQLCTVTAAMMCAAVTCVLENRGFNTKDVFLQEMEKLLQSGGFGSSCGVAAERPARPAPVTRPAAETPAPPAEKPYVPAVPVPAPKPPTLDADEDDDDVMAAVGMPMPQQQEAGVVRINSLSEFQKLGEYGFRNDEKIVRVELPEGVQHLPGSFFYGCSNLVEVWLPDSLQEIGPYAFYGCESLADRAYERQRHAFGNRRVCVCHVLVACVVYGSGLGGNAGHQRVPLLREAGKGELL